MFTEKVEVRGAYIKGEIVKKEKVEFDIKLILGITPSTVKTFNEDTISSLINELTLIKNKMHNLNQM